MMYGVAVCGWTVGVYLLQLLWENIRVILLTYQTYVAWYIFITGFISFLSKCFHISLQEGKLNIFIQFVIDGVL